MTEKDTINKINSEVWATLGVSKISGIGVIAIRDIPKGTIFTKSQDEMWRYYELSGKAFMKLLKPIRNIILDRTQQSQREKIKFRHPNCMARLQSFMNHSENPNSDGVKTLVDIKAGEEITENYIRIAPRKLHRFVLKRYADEKII